MVQGTDIHGTLATTSFRCFDTSLMVGQNVGRFIRGKVGVSVYLHLSTCASNARGSTSNAIVSYMLPEAECGINYKSAKKSRLLPRLHQDLGPLKASTWCCGVGARKRSKFSAVHVLTRLINITLAASYRKTIPKVGS